MIARVRGHERPKAHPAEEENREPRGKRGRASVVSSAARGAPGGGEKPLSLMAHDSDPGALW